MRKGTLVIFSSKNEVDVAILYPTIAAAKTGSPIWTHLLFNSIGMVLDRKRVDGRNLIKILFDVGEIAWAWDIYVKNVT